jgi:hypothetical protein
MSIQNGVPVSKVEFVKIIKTLDVPKAKSILLVNINYSIRMWNSNNWRGFEDSFPIVLECAKIIYKLKPSESSGFILSLTKAFFDKCNNEKKIYVLTPVYKFYNEQMKQLIATI